MPHFSPFIVCKEQKEILNLEEMLWRRYIQQVNFNFTPYLGIKLIKLCLLLNCANQEIKALLI